MFDTVTAAIGLLGQSHQLIAGIREQHRCMTKVPNKCNPVEMGLDKIGKILHELKGYTREDLPEMGRRQVESMSKYLEKTREVLEKEQNRGDVSTENTTLFPGSKSARNIGRAH